MPTCRYRRMCGAPYALLLTKYYILGVCSKVERGSGPVYEHGYHTIRFSHRNN